MDKNLEIILVKYVAVSRRFEELVNKYKSCSDEEEKLMEEDRKELKILLKEMDELEKALSIELLRK